MLNTVIASIKIVISRKMKFTLNIDANETVHPHLFLFEASLYE